MGGGGGRERDRDSVLIDSHLVDYCDAIAQEDVLLMCF